MNDADNYLIRLAQEPAIKDSGTRHKFESGAVRDMAEGKGNLAVFPAESILRLSKHYEAGAQKYGFFNYQKGIPVSSFMSLFARIARR